MSLPGTLAAALLPRYRIERELGVGGMATVYLAHDEKHQRDVAIKVLKPELAAVVGAERFIAEIRTTAHLRHPHILPLFDSGSADGLPFYVMPNHEFVNDWSPDGREIVFHSMREGGQRDVLVVSADGTKTEPVATSPAEEQHSAWGPDGNSIVFDADSPGQPSSQLYVVTRRERGAPWGTPRRLTSLGSSDPKWSPDGRLIAYCVAGQLHVMAPDGTGDRVLVSPSNISEQPEPSYAIWARDSQTIYYKAYDDRRQSSIWVVSVSGGPPRLLVRFDDPSRRSLRREFATDGHRFYFTIAHEESDLWAMELISK